MKVRITILAKLAHGSVGDAKGWALGLHQEINKALSDPEGADLDIDSVLIEQKLEGYTKIGGS